MTAKDTITLPREVVQEAVKALEFAERNHDGEQSLYTTEIAALRKALAAEQPKPSGYAYRYADGVLRLNDGSQFNGGWPVEAVPYWFATPALAAPRPEPEPALQVDALRYRWIAENALAIDFVADPDNMVQIWHGTDPARFSAGKTLDEAVDAARRRT